MTIITCKLCACHVPAEHLELVRAITAVIVTVTPQARFNALAVVTAELHWTARDVTPLIRPVTTVVVMVTHQSISYAMPIVTAVKEMGQRLVRGFF